jgi:hypothetical protein
MKFVKISVLPTGAKVALNKKLRSLITIASLQNLARKKTLPIDKQS